MQARREVAVFGAVSSSNIFPDAVSNIIVDYVLTKEADELIQTTRLFINLNNRIHFIYTNLAVWENDKNRLEQMTHESTVMYDRYKFNFVMQPWLMVQYRTYVADIVEMVHDIAEQETRWNTYWGNRIPLEFEINESDM